MRSATHKLLGVLLLSLVALPRDCRAASLAANLGDSRIYVVDSSDLEGPAAAGISPTAAKGIVCVNNFVVLGGYSTITEVTVQWGLVLGTTNVTAGVWSDPNQDGVPDDAVLLATSAIAPAVAGQYLQQLYFPAPQYVGPSGTSFFVGFFWQESAVEENDLFMGRDRPLEGGWPSWFKTWTDAPPDPSDLSNARYYQGTHRAFVIRPSAVVPEPSVLLLFAFAAGIAWIRHRPEE